METEFKDLVEYILSSRKPRLRKVVFLVDELDRCLPENVVPLLESIKNYLSIQGACYVFAMDKDIVSQGIKSKYPNLTEMDGHDYLEKIIQFSYELPFPCEAVVRGILRSFERNFPSIGSSNLEFAPKVVELAGIRSIRTIKKIARRYVVFMEGGMKLGGPTHPQLFFLLALLYETQPKLYELIRQNKQRSLFDDLGALPADYRTRGDMFGEPVRTAIRLSDDVNIAAFVRTFKKAVFGEENKALAADLKTAFDLIEKLGG